MPSISFSFIQVSHSRLNRRKLPQLPFLIDHHVCRVQRDFLANLVGMRPKHDNDRRKMWVVGGAEKMQKY